MEITKEELSTLLSTAVSAGIAAAQQPKLPPSPNSTEAMIHVIGPLLNTEPEPKPRVFVLTGKHTMSPNPTAPQAYHLALDRFTVPVAIRVQERLAGELAGKWQIVEAVITDDSALRAACQSQTENVNFAGQLAHATASHNEKFARELGDKVAKHVNQMHWHHGWQNLIRRTVGKCLGEIDGLVLDHSEEGGGIFATFGPPARPRTPEAIMRAPEPPVTAPERAAPVEAQAPITSPVDPRIALGYHETSPRAPGRAPKRGSELTAATIAGPDPGGRSPAPREIGKRDSPPRADES